MDGAAVSRIERWTRNLLEAEARKRGVRDPEMHSRGELLRAIVEHDYGPKRSLRSARKLVGSLLEGAAQALPMLSSRRDKGGSPYDGPAHLPSPAAAVTPAVTATTPAVPSHLELRREPTRLELTWQVNHLDIERARRLLGHHGELGELSLRVVCVQADPTHVVRSEVTEHGPLDPHGNWTLNLPSAECNCIGSVGLRSGEQFVSITHKSSRVSRSAPQAEASA
jgi:hypothetical protein